MCFVGALCADRLNYRQLYRAANPGLGVRLYHMFYGNSSEEHKFLAGIRKEKNAFERLIRERGVRAQLDMLSI